MIILIFFIYVIQNLFLFHRTYLFKYTIFYSAFNPLTLKFYNKTKRNKFKKNSFPLIHDKLCHSTYFPRELKISFTFLCRLSGFIDIRKAIKAVIDIDNIRTFFIFFVSTSQLNSILSYSFLTVAAINHIRKLIGEVYK